MTAELQHPSLAAYEAIAAALAPREVAAGQMFGKRCLKHDGKAFAAYHQEAMAFKLAPEAHARAIALSGARLWDPSGKGRPMKEWVQVPFDHASAWPELAEAALGGR